MKVQSPEATNLQDRLALKATRSKTWVKLAPFLIESGLSYGSVLTKVELERVLEVSRDTSQFDFILCRLRRLLLESGFYLTSRGQKGEQYIILKASDNANIIQSISDRAIDTLNRGIHLGRQTRREKLSLEERRRHDGELEKMAHKLILLKNSEKVWQQVYGKKQNEVSSL